MVLRFHLPGKQVDLSPMVFILGEAFVNLRSGPLRDTAMAAEISLLVSEVALIDLVRHAVSDKGL